MIYFTYRLLAVRSSAIGAVDVLSLLVMLVVNEELFLLLHFGVHIVNLKEFFPAKRHFTPRGLTIILLSYKMIKLQKKLSDSKIKILTVPSNFT